jgi:hypothetical protein
VVGVTTLPTTDAPGTRRRLEAAVPDRASSLDGRRFSFQASLTDLALLPGDYVTIGPDRLAYVHSVEEAVVDPTHLDLPGAVPGSRVSVARGLGVVLAGPGTPFHDEPFTAADAAVVQEWVTATRPATAALDVGALSRLPSVRFPLDAGGFDRHTFFCGQSGSGKTYALGTVLERLLMETSLRIVVLDPNSDFIRLGEVRDGVAAPVAEAYRRAAESVVVRRSGERGGQRLHVRFTDCAADEQAAALRMGPIADREEYGALVELIEAGFSVGAGVEPLMRSLLSSTDPHVQALGSRLRNLGLHRWHVWSEGDADSVQDLVGPEGPRCLVVDLGSLSTPGEQAIAAESVLTALWRRRTARQPVLVVIDEAHNVCPRTPTDPVTALSTELAARIAAEGRKFGLYLLVSTQRPQRVNELVVSQCDNLVLMRMNASGDLDYLGDTLSFAPRPLLERAMEFRQGESLVAGKIASHPTFVRFGPRIAEEGGSDVPTSWALPTRVD